MRMGKNDWEKFDDLQLIAIKMFCQDKQFQKTVRDQLRKRGLYLEQQKELLSKAS